MSTTLSIILIILVILLIGLVLFLIFRKPVQNTELENSIKTELSNNAQTITTVFNSSFSNLGTALNDNQTLFRESSLDKINMIADRVSELSDSNEKRLDTMRDTISQGMKDIRDENNDRLKEIKDIVDEKLQDTLEKRISESFKTVNEQLEQVYRGIGEMHSLASDVGGLKKILSGVKTRGILGEVQLKSILAEILAPVQYEENVVTIPESRDRVEFAIKLPGPSDDSVVYLPIDSKFPGDTYEKLKDAQESGDKELIKTAAKNLEQRIKEEARDIREKYIYPPYTTNFGILFLPFEGLYCEVINRGIFEEIQKEYQITIAGPSTMAVILNSLQMGFRTLAIQKQSHDVWLVLGAVKSEFDKFEEVFQKMKNHLNQTNKDLDSLIGVRTKAINKKLQEVQIIGNNPVNIIDSNDEFLSIFEEEE